ncbi:hypothetical protein PV04_09110 [Phialophora macrospora]|uniref:Major facilitator superfamily (MFS) profile domain-containing protein n=1 Tax=Phialophora macrospora TaxID=1851006 RepID=A0A0D2CG70_9EURO|nr:hypothetical protein PV04_09110 [Phialophora macrospora]
MSSISRNEKGDIAAAVDDVSPHQDHIGAGPDTGSHELTKGDLEIHHKNLFGTYIDVTHVMPGADEMYNAKIQIVNQAILDIGMGRYQWQLTILTGFGWFVDNIWMFSLAIISPVIIPEFHVKKIAYLTVGQYVGLILGSTGWPISADFIGRRWAFNLSLGLAGMCGLVGAGMPSFTGLCVIAAFVGISAGGNQPVDSSIFLEFIPATHQWLLTVQGVYWGVGKTVAAAIAWPLIANYSCAKTATNCTYEQNMGWRYTYWTFGAVTLFMFICRFIFRLHETPKYLLGRGRDAEAVEVLRKVAAYNGTTTWLTVDHFRAIDERFAAAAADADVALATETTNAATLRRAVEAFRPDKIMAVFGTKKGAISTILLILIWSLIGLAWPLYNNFITIYLQQKGVLFHSSLSKTYRNYLFQAMCAIPGCLIGGICVELPRFGRKGAGACCSILTGVFLFLFTRARSEGAVLAFTCLISFSQNLTSGILFAYTPETFAAPVRGTGTGLCGGFYRVWGLIAAIITSFIGVTSSMPIWIAAGAWMVAGLTFLALPFESRAKASS